MTQESKSYFDVAVENLTLLKDKCENYERASVELQQTVYDMSIEVLKVKGLNNNLNLDVQNLKKCIEELTSHISLLEQDKSVLKSALYGKCDNIKALEVEVVELKADLDCLSFKHSYAKETLGLGTMIIDILKPNVQVGGGMLKCYIDFDKACRDLEV